MHSATTQTDESAWARRPASSEPKATVDIAQARTADSGAPQNSTKSPPAASSTSRRALGPSRVRASATERSDVRIARWLPDTATRWATPQVANTSVSPRSRMCSRSPQTLPASTAPPSLSAGESRRTTASLSASRLRSGSPGGRIDVTRTILTLPATPARRLAVGLSPLVVPVGGEPPDARDDAPASDGVLGLQPHVTRMTLAVAGAGPRAPARLGLRGVGDDLERPGRHRARPKPRDGVGGEPAAHAAARDRKRRAERDEDHGPRDLHEARPEGEPGADARHHRDAHRDGRLHRKRRRQAHPLGHERRDKRVQGRRHLGAVGPPRLPRHRSTRGSWRASSPLCPTRA